MQSDRRVRRKNWSELIDRVRNPTDDEDPQGVLRGVGLPPVLSAMGTGTRSRRASAGVPEQAAQALTGMREPEWNTLLVALSLDIDGKSENKIRNRLVREVERSRERDRFWPAAARRKPCACGRSPADDYTIDLIQLAIYQLRVPAAFDTQYKLAEWFGYSESHWRNTMHKPFGVVWGPLQLWFMSAIAHIEKRLARGRRNQ